jgi:hypothetical protein
MDLHGINNLDGMIHKLCFKFRHFSIAGPKENGRRHQRCGHHYYYNESKTEPENLSRLGVSQDFLDIFWILWFRAFAGVVGFVFKNVITSIVGGWRPTAGFTQFCQTALADTFVPQAVGIANACVGTP